MAEPILLSQNDPRWKDIKVGTSNQTIGQIGCVDTCIAMKYGLTPDKVNELLNSVKDGYVQTNLVNWTKIPQALPGAEFVYKYSYYDNEIVKQNLPCIVEVDAAPIGGTRHWVLYVGNHILYDPFDGKAKSTDTYKPLSFVVLKGQYSQSAPQPTPQTVNTGGNTITLNPHGIDINNQESVQVVFDTWNDVANNYKYVSMDNYLADLAKARENMGVSEDPNYTLLKEKGYTTLDDVTKALKTKDDDNLALQKEIATVRLRNSKLAGIVQEIEEEDHTTHELGQQAQEENKELKNNLEQFAKEMGVDSTNQKSLMSAFFGMKELADRFIKKLEDEQKEKKAKKEQKEVVQSSDKKDSNWLIDLLQLKSFGKEVKSS